MINRAKKMLTENIVVVFNDALYTDEFVKLAYQNYALITSDKCRVVLLNDWGKQYEKSLTEQNGERVEAVNCLIDILSDNEQVTYLDINSKNPDTLFYELIRMADTRPVAVLTNNSAIADDVILLGSMGSFTAHKVSAYSIDENGELCSC